MSKYNLGDLVTIVTENSKTGHEFKRGETVKISKIRNDGTVDACEKLDKSEWWYVSESDIVPYEKRNKTISNYSYSQKEVDKIIKQVRKEERERIYQEIAKVLKGDKKDGIK